MYFQTHIYILDYCNPSKQSIPWEEINIWPDDFYNTSIFDFGAQLGNPAELRIGDVFVITSSLLRHPASNPFLFWTCEQELSDLSLGKFDLICYTNILHDSSLYH